MYNPSRFQSQDAIEALALMKRYPFAQLISVHENAPFISHLPLVAEKNGDELLLIGHLARANPHEQLLGKGKVTVVFRGAHTYITPVWYAKNDVPTWNYSALHLTGRAELLEDFESTVECLQKLSVEVEKSYPSGWNFSLPKDLMPSESLLKAIVGFKIRVESFSFKQKLSQNRSAEDKAGVLKGLSLRTDEESRSVLEDMRKIYSNEVEG